MRNRDTIERTIEGQLNSPQERAVPLLVSVDF